MPDAPVSAAAKIVPAAVERIEQRSQEVDPDSDADTLPPPDACIGNPDDVPCPVEEYGGALCEIEAGERRQGGLAANISGERVRLGRGEKRKPRGKRRGNRPLVGDDVDSGNDVGDDDDDGNDYDGGDAPGRHEEASVQGVDADVQPARPVDIVSGGVADIVSINYGGLEERERLMAVEEVEKEKQWGARLYPRIEQGAAFADDATAAELCLSSLPESQRPEPPIGVVPPRVNRFLKDFQRDGVMFLYRLSERGRGGLLADAMGLGKTVQMIAFLGAMFGIWERKSTKSCRILVSLPSSLVSNWKRELEKWTPFRVHMFDSKSSVREAIKTDSCDVVLVTNDLLRSDLEASENCNAPQRRLAKIRWNVLVVDEVHSLKNRGRKLHNAVRDLNVPLKYGISGTIIQNKLADLHNVMEILVGPANGWPDKRLFDKLYGKPIRVGSTKDASPFEKNEAKAARNKLRVLLKKHCIRRPKAIIEGDIPPKTDNLVSLVLPRHTLQGRMWFKFINSYDAYMVRKAKDPCSCGSQMESQKCCHGYPATEANLRNAPLWRQQHSDGNPCKKCPYCLDFRLAFVGQQITCHALLLFPSEADEKGETRSDDDLRRQERIALMEYYTSGEVDSFTRIVALEKELGMSGKLDVALRLLTKFRSEGHKTIVFYSKMRLGGILMRWAVDNAIGFRNIDGSVPKRERQKIIDQFQAEPVGILPIFFVSKKAGGTGLNITAADRVLIFEPDWNVCVSAPP